MPAKTRAHPFSEYAEYYDLVYAGKPYGTEANFVDRHLRNSGASGGALLELGCGTGRHAAEFARLGWTVKGVDLSAGMVKQARARAVSLGKPLRQRLSFAVGDMGKVRTGEKYDAVVSLFHVMGYQTSNEELHGAIDTAAAHLRPGGVFFFDFWFGPAVLTDRPSVRVKRFESERITATRISEPSIDPVANVVTIEFDISIENRATGAVHRIRETHRVRYFFIPELIRALQDHGFDVLGEGAWLKDERLDFGSWYGWIAARRR